MKYWITNQDSALIGPFESSESADKWARKAFADFVPMTDMTFEEYYSVTSREDLEKIFSAKWDDWEDYDWEDLDPCTPEEYLSGVQGKYEVNYHSGTTLISEWFNSFEDVQSFVDKLPYDKLTLTTEYGEDLVVLVTEYNEEKFPVGQPFWYKDDSN